MLNIIFDNFNLLFSFTVIWFLIGFAWLYWKRKKSNLFQDGPSNVLLEEKSASGRSYRNWYSKLGGARNCLKLIITADKLWVTPIFPFSVASTTFDLDHRIKIHSIFDITESKLMLKKSLVIKYSDINNNEHTVEIIPKNIQ